LHTHDHRLSIEHVRHGRNIAQHAANEGVHNLERRDINKYPPAEPEVLRLLAPQRGLTAIEKSKSKTERTTNCIIPELSNFGSPPAEPGVYLD
jgi:hypothetical protein